MKEFIDKLIGRLKEQSKWVAYGNRDRDIGMTHRVVPFDKLTAIVNELAEEYKGGWIPCSGCEDCQHKECEYYGKV